MYKSEFTPDITTEPTRYVCRHIFTDGHRCASPALRGEPFCYFHHTKRRPIPPAEAKTRKGRRNTFDLPQIEDRSSIQQALNDILQKIAANDLDPRRAGLLLYGLQTAALNLPRPDPKAEPARMVEAIQIDDQFGPLAPIAEVGELQQHEKGPAALMLEELERNFPREPWSGRMDGCAEDLSGCIQIHGRAEEHRHAEQQVSQAFGLGSHKPARNRSFSPRVHAPKIASRSKANPFRLENLHQTCRGGGAHRPVTQIP